MASNLLAMASNLRAMASNLRAMASNLRGSLVPVQRNLVGLAMLQALRIPMQLEFDFLYEPYLNCLLQAASCCLFGCGNRLLLQG